jgi:PAS domain-containing protein
VLFETLLEHCPDLFYFKDRQSRFVRFSRAAMEFCDVYRDGRVTWTLTSKMPWRDGAGKIVGTFGVSKDVTELKEAE